MHLPATLLVPLAVFALAGCGPDKPTPVRPLVTAPTSTSTPPSSSLAPSTTPTASATPTPAAVAAGAGVGSGAGEAAARRVARAAVPTTRRPAPTTTKTAPRTPATTKTTTKRAASYGSCAQAKAAGAAPLYRGGPGYSSKLDRDGDGVACES